MSVPGAEGHHGGHLGQAESNRQAGAVTETARVVDRAAERSLCFKFDVRILPVLAVMCKWRDGTPRP